MQLWSLSSQVQCLQSNAVFQCLNVKDGDWIINQSSESSSFMIRKVNNLTSTLILALCPVFFPLIQMQTQHLAKIQIQHLQEILLLTTEPLVSFPPLIQMEALYLRVSLGQKTLPFFSQIKGQQTKTIVETTNISQGKRILVLYL